MMRMTAGKGIKKFMIAAAVVVLAAACVLSGCNLNRSNADGRVENVSIYEIYDATNAARAEEGLDTLTFLEFIEEYLSFGGGELEEASSLKGSINRSLYSSVSILTNFTYSTGSGGLFGASEYNLMYVGSGVIVDVDKEAGDAYIVTNCHVVYSTDADDTYCSDVHAFLYGMDEMGVAYDVIASRSGTQYKYTIDDKDSGMKCEVVAASVAYDIALLKVTDSDVIRNNTVYAAEFSDSDVTDVGETVYTIGNAGGYGMSVTSGIVSKDSEYIPLSLDDDNRNVTYYRVLRTDAPVNGGNSGGGLFDPDGKLIGIVNSRSTDSEEVNMGYALPAGNVRRVVRSMIDNDDGDSATVAPGIRRFELGATVEPDAPYSATNRSGITQIYDVAVVTSVTSGGAADKAGLKKNDIITHLSVVSSSGEVREDLDVERSYMVCDALISVRQGDTVTLTVKRGDSYRDIVMTADEVSLPAAWEAKALNNYDFVYTI